MAWIQAVSNKHSYTNRLVDFDYVVRKRGAFAVCSRVHITHNALDFTNCALLSNSFFRTVRLNKRKARLQPTVLRMQIPCTYGAQVWHQGPAASVGDWVTGQLVSANRLATLMRPPALRNWLPQEHKLWLKLEAPANLLLGV